MSDNPATQYLTQSHYIVLIHLSNCDANTVAWIYFLSGVSNLTISLHRNVMTTYCYVIVLNSITIVTYPLGNTHQPLRQWLLVSILCVLVSFLCVFFYIFLKEYLFWYLMVTWLRYAQFSCIFRKPFVRSGNHNTLIFLLQLSSGENLHSFCCLGFMFLLFSTVSFRDCHFVRQINFELLYIWAESLC